MFICIYLVCQVVRAIDQNYNWIPAKMTDGIDKLQGNHFTKEIVFNSPPRKAIGPPALMVLNQICINGNFDRFEYTVCPFHNITQKRVTSSQESLIGVFSRWSPYEVTDEMKISMNLEQAFAQNMRKGTDKPFVLYTEMNFIDGDVCGHGNYTQIP